MSQPEGLDQAVLEAVFSQSPVGLHVLDPDLRVSRVNTAAAVMRGISAEEVVGRPLAQVYERFDPQEVERLAREVLATGVPRRERLVRGYPRSDPEREHVFAISAFRLESPDGRILGLALEAVDVTERERARARLDLQHAAHQRIGRSLDVLRTAQELVDVTVPGLADSVVVALSDAVMRAEDPQARPGDGPPLLRCAATGGIHGMPDGPELGAILLPGLFGESLDGPPSLLAAGPGEPPGHGTLAAPLTVRGTVLGAVALQRRQRPDPFEPADLALAADIATRTALCLDNALRYTREHSVMLALQGQPGRRSGTAGSAVETVGRETAHRHRSPGAGSAWYDVIELSGARVALVVGRAQSQGIGALAAMSQLRTAVYTLAALDLEPHDLLARLHDTTRRLAQEQRAAGGGTRSGDLAGSLVASCGYLVHDPVSGLCTLAQAGSQLLLIARPDGTVDPAPLPPGPLLGGDGPPFATAEYTLDAGSTLCLGSRHPAEPGRPPLDRLAAVLKEPGRPLDPVADGIAELLGPDAVLLVARTRTLAEDQVAAWEIEDTLSAVSGARRHVRAALERWQAMEAADTLELIASELVTNAIRHGAPPVTLRLVRDRLGVDQLLTCEVTDGALTAPHLRHAKAGDEGGRGLFICASLAENWGVRYAERAKTVWVQVSPD